ncbi:MAG: DUF4870 domain-containing protein [Ottowia sp.]|nr:DUF4870 domain-containing protein [Ottowia sp.]
MTDDATPNTAETAAPALEAPQATARTLPDTANSLLAVGAHVGGLFTCVLVPLIIFLIARDDSKLAFTVGHGREALNFQITMLIAAIVLTVSLVGIALLPALALYDTACIIIASIKTINGDPWRYPLTLRLIK